MRRLTSLLFGAPLSSANVAALAWLTMVVAGVTGYVAAYAVMHPNDFDDEVFVAAVFLMVGIAPWSVVVIVGLFRPAAAILRAFSARPSRVLHIAVFLVSAAVLSATAFVATVMFFRLIGASRFQDESFTHDLRYLLHNTSFLVTFLCAVLTGWTVVSVAALRRARLGQPPSSTT